MRIYTKNGTEILLRHTAAQSSTELEEMPYYDSVVGHNGEDYGLSFSFNLETPDGNVTVIPADDVLQRSIETRNSSPDFFASYQINPNDYCIVDAPYPE